MHKRIRIILCILLFTLAGTSSVQANELDSSTWVKMSDKYNYSPPEAKQKEAEKPEKKEERKETKGPNGGGFDTNFINILLYLGIAALIALLIYVLVQADVIKVGSRKVQLNQTYDAENPEELVLSELEKELQDAAFANNYNRCLRYEFLLLFERLQSKGLIRWHKYNTNGEYLNQIIQFVHYKRIRDLTIVYEYYWYGEHILSLEDYEKIAVLFTQLREEMDHA